MKKLRLLARIPPNICHEKRDSSYDSRSIDADIESTEVYERNQSGSKFTENRIWAPVAYMDQYWHGWLCPFDDIALYTVRSTGTNAYSTIS